MKYGLKELPKEDTNMPIKKKTQKKTKTGEKSDKVLAERAFGLEHSGWFTSTDVGMELVEKMSKSGPRTVFSLDEQIFLNVTKEGKAYSDRPIKMYRIVEWQSEKDFWKRD